MTLIVGTIHKSFPVLMGDILVTTENIKESKNNMMLPTYFGGDQNELFKGSNRIPVELNQKVYIITPKLCLALAGNLWYLKMFLEGVRDRFKYLDVTPDNVKSLCDEFDKEFLSQINFIFFGNYLKGTKRHFFYYGSNVNKEINHDYFGFCSAAGSGATSFLQEVNSYRNIIYEPSGHKPLEALSTNIYLITKFLLKEKVSTMSIEEGWGCGFEVVCYNGESFYKVDNITYIYFKLDLVDGFLDFEKLTLYFLINFKYHNDFLEITAYDSKNVGTFFVSPIDKKNKFEANRKFTFGTDKVALCYFFEDSNGITSVYSQAYLNEKQKGVHINIDYGKKIIAVEIDPQIHQSILSKRT
jgi:hypothetical protein